MTRTRLLLATCASVAALFTIFVRTSDAGQADSIVRLQQNSPGTPQTGNTNITGVAIAGSFSGDGSALTNLDAGAIVGGTLADARLSANVPLLDAANAFSSSNTFAGNVGIGTASPGYALDVAGTASVTAFLMPTGASAGMVLTSDASGNGTWQNVVLPLPYAASANVSASSAVFSLANNGTGHGIYGAANSSSGLTLGIWGRTSSTGTNATGVYGEAITSTGSNNGVWGTSPSSSGYGVYGTATASSGVVVGVGGRNYSNDGHGVHGFASSGSGPTKGVTGLNYSTGGIGVLGSAEATSGSTYGVYGQTGSPTGYGVVGNTYNGTASSWALYAFGRSGASGTKSFRIDHPLDPANKYLLHYSSEGPEPLNVYSGNITTNAKGYATVVLPDYFAEINKDFRYQLTIVDDGEQNDFVMAKVVSKIRENRFTVRTSRPNIEVSWRVEARRNDLWVQRYGAPVEMDKPEAERGTYQHPELYGLPPGDPMNAHVPEKGAARPTK